MNQVEFNKFKQIFNKFKQIFFTLVCPYKSLHKSLFCVRKHSSLYAVQTSLDKQNRKNRNKIEIINFKPVSQGYHGNKSQRPIY